MTGETHAELLSSVVKKAWDITFDMNPPEAAIFEQAVGPPAAALCDGFLTAMNTHNLRTNQVRVVLDGVRIPPYHYSTSKHLKAYHHDVVSRESLNRYLQRGATVVLDDAQAAIPMVDRLCADLTGSTGLSTSGTIFASPPQADGFALHQDAEDVVIVQLAGAKHWTVFPPLSRQKSSMLKRSECGEPVIDTELHAGDIIVMPKGCPHKTASNSTAGSVHITVGLFPVTVRDLLVRLVERSPSVLLDEPIPRDPQDIFAITSSWLYETLDENGSSRISGLIDQLVGELRSHLRGDTTAFRIPFAGAPAEGGTYRVLNKVSEATRLFLAARLGRTDDQDLDALVASLKAKSRGDTFTYREFAVPVGDATAAEEVLHELLRMRQIAQVSLREGMG